MFKSLGDLNQRGWKACRLSLLTVWLVERRTGKERHWMHWISSVAATATATWKVRVAHLINVGENWRQFPLEGFHLFIYLFISFRIIYFWHWCEGNWTPPFFYGGNLAHRSICNFQFYQFNVPRMSQKILLIIKDIGFHFQYFSFFSFNFLFLIGHLLFSIFTFYLTCHNWFFYLYFYELKE